MINSGEETPSRHEILSMVKKHSKSLEKMSADEQDTSDVENDSNFWHGVFDVYFIRGKESRGRQDDDLLFFVRKMSCKAYGLTENEDGPAPYFVRRWAPKLDELLGESLAEVDWRRSFYLNMIAHTSFTVTVAICSNEALKTYQGSKDTRLSPIYKVVKTVYASPSRVNFHLDSKKEVETTPAYPDICFAVDDFDSTFDAVVLTEKDHCYCVLLNSHDGAAFPSEHGKIDKDSSDSNTDIDSRKMKDPKVTLFSGFVSYQMVREAYEDSKSMQNPLVVMVSWDPLLLLGQEPALLISRFGNLVKFIGYLKAITKVGKVSLRSSPVKYSVLWSVGSAPSIHLVGGRNRFGSLLSLGHHTGKADRLYMKGPGGRGEVEVAVSGVVDQSQVVLGPVSPMSSKKSIDLGSIFRKAASVASVAAKHAIAAATASYDEDEMFPLKCCLMSISLPWDTIAHDLLFKESPPVNME